MIYYDKKNALKKRRPDQIIAASTVTNYIIFDSYQDFINTIHNSRVKQFYECIERHTLVNLFFDIEIYKDENEDTTPTYYTNYRTILEIMKQAVESLDLLKPYTKRYIITEAHNHVEQYNRGKILPIKRSFHVVIRLIDENGDEWYFEDVEVFKQLYKSLGLKKYKSIQKDNSKKGTKESAIFDSSVYRFGLFRTIYSSKDGEDIPRPFTRSIESDNFIDDIETFVGYTKTTNLIHIPTEHIQHTNQTNNQLVKKDIVLDQDTINVLKRFVSEKYHIDINMLLEPILTNDKGYITIPSVNKYCHFEEREHKSNHQYYILDSYSIKQKCHDEECESKKHNELTIVTFPLEFIEQLKPYITFKNLEQLSIVKKESLNIVKTYDQDINNVIYDSDYNIFKSQVSDNCILKFKGECDVCQKFHIVSSDGYYIECVVCKSRAPLQKIPLPNGHISMFLTQININIIQNDDYLYTNIKLDPAIYNNDKLTMLMSNVLNGHKQSTLVEFFCEINDCFKYHNRTWYYCIDNIWKQTDENYILGGVIDKELTDQLTKILVFYNITDINDPLYMNIDKLITFLKKISTHRELPNGCKPFLTDSDIVNKLDSNHHLLPFTNGVYDLKNNVFRDITKEDYVLTHLDYPYNPDADTSKFDKVYSEIITHKSTREYMLQQFSRIMNADLPNTLMYILTGVGSNGKSILINLLNHTFNNFSNKIKVTLLTHTNNSNSNNADPEMYKLKNLRLAYFAEPNMSDKLNGMVIKDLTGGEEISARQLRQASESFKIRAKMILTCNYVPEIDEASNAMWRRLNIIHLTSDFVDNPIKKNQFKIDYDLEENIIKDPDYRNGLLKRLLEYYYKPKIPVPEPVEAQTKFYIESSNKLITWLKRYIVYDTTKYITGDTITELYNESVDETQQIQKKNMIKMVENFLAKYYTNDLNPRYERIYVSKDDKPFGWKHIHIPICEATPPPPEEIVEI